MADEILYCLKLADPSGEFEPAAELLNALEFDFSSYFDRETFAVWHTVYAPNPETRAANLEKLQQNLPMWRELGVELMVAESFELPKSQWAEAWKKYFQPVVISDKLVVRPSWIEEPPQPGQQVLQIDPGMSFGTGQHATTNYCLHQIDRFAGQKKSLLDAGCGSGILAIAGALLGYEIIDAFDFDADAVQVAAENIAANGVTAAVTPQVGDAAVWQGRTGGYDLVCANILGHLLIAYRYNIRTYVAAGGHLVLAGILGRDFDGVSRAYQEIGFTELERFPDGEWTGGLFQRTQDLK